ncbi:MAG: hypothetical protein EON92_07960 [Burkholderiales bacterium]|nr:MAG: hypothetical protein EON92_07960 [Burkholderiales bacterium]
MEPRDLDVRPKTLVANILDAIKREDFQSITELVGRNPDQLHYTPFGFQTWLGYAAGHSSLAVVEHLLSLGFDVNEGDPRENVKPLCCACFNGQLAVAELLLKAGAVMDTATSVQNPMFAAVVGRSPQIVRLVLQGGIDPTVRYNSTTMNEMDAVAFSLMQGEAECARIIATWISSGDEATANAALERALWIAKKNAYRPVPSDET